ncbi:hypothetical protein [Sphingomonas endolithica]|jgi:ElaB/YqjD/DUF883 family membrane-anchored ribosome-binding protein|uniref:hypothetical protein n=1 Tax=Sphingomonas endolithica TaxID=2972485 RepID=UPI0021AF9AC3|nr:hypothetical protein [Sphingomonas sp. ZFBP2030]
MNQQTKSHAAAGAATQSDTQGKAPAAPKGTVDKTLAAANKALDRTLDGARDAADRTAQVIDANPLPVLVGGLALGALAGALLPRSQREVQMLAPVGVKLRTTATGALHNAKQTGLAELGALGLSRGAMSDQAGKLVGGVLTALVTAGTAAITNANAKKAEASSTD